MALALELYNRASLNNKLDGFVMMYSFSLVLLNHIAKSSVSLLHILFIHVSIFMVRNVGPSDNTWSLLTTLDNGLNHTTSMIIFSSLSKPSLSTSCSIVNAGSKRITLPLTPQESRIRPFSCALLIMVLVSSCKG